MFRPTHCNSITRRIQIFTIVLLFNLVPLVKVYGTHLKGGWIETKRVEVSNYTFQIQVNLVTDQGSVVYPGSGILSFGDGETFQFESYDPDKIQFIEDGIAVFTITHVFPAPGNYIVSYEEKNRNEVNNAENSIDQPFYITNKIIIDPFLGSNESPQFSSRNIKFYRGQPLSCVINAFDSNQDSLSFHFIKPLGREGEPLEDFYYPDDARFYTGDSQMTELTISPFSGLIEWPSPGMAGDYIVAVLVKEWRKTSSGTFIMGETIYDLQFSVLDEVMPELTWEVPIHACIEPDESWIDQLNIGLVSGAYTLKVFTDLDGVSLNQESMSSEGMFNSYVLDFDSDLKLELEYANQLVESSDHKIVYELWSSAGEFVSSQVTLLGLGCQAIGVILSAPNEPLEDDGAKLFLVRNGSELVLKKKKEFENDLFEVSIHTMSGQEVMQSTISVDQNQIMIPNYSKLENIYLLRYSSQGKTDSFKLYIPN